VVTVLVALLALGLSAPLHRMVHTELPSLPPAPPRQILVVNPPPVPPNPFSTAFEPEPELVPRASSRPVEAPLP